MILLTPIEIARIVLNPDADWRESTEGLCKAQAKKILEWAKGDCDDETLRCECPKCWEELRKEIE